MWYWFKDGGWLVLLVAVGLTRWSVLRRDDRRVPAIGIPAVLVPHSMTSTRDGYVSAALPLALFLGALLVAVELASLWSQAQGVFGRLMIVIVIAMTVRSGILVNAQVLP